MDALLPLNKWCVQVYCFNPSVTLRSVQSGSHTQKKKEISFYPAGSSASKTSDLLEAVFHVRFLVTYTPWHNCRLRAIRVNSPENVNTPLRTVLSVFVLIWKGRPSQENSEAPLPTVASRAEATRVPMTTGATRCAKPTATAQPSDLLTPLTRSVSRLERAAVSGC